MKKIILPFLLAVFTASAFYACSPPLRAIPMSMNSQERAKFVGNWTLTNVTYLGVDESSAQKAFDQAPPKEFTGSTWQLADNGSGKYALANGVSQNISWSVNGGDALGPIFQFKKPNESQTPEKATTGYQLTIGDNDGTTMTLKSLVYIGAKNGYVVYTFTKAKN